MGHVFVLFLVSGGMFCSVRYFCCCTSAIDCLRRFVSEMTSYMSSEMLNLTNLLSNCCHSANRFGSCVRSSSVMLN